MDWLKGTFTGKPHISWENRRFPVGSIHGIAQAAAQERCICHGHFSFSDEDEPTLAGLQPEDATEGDRQSAGNAHFGWDNVATSTNI